MNKEMESIQQAQLIMTYKTDKIYLYSHYAGSRKAENFSRPKTFRKFISGTQPANLSDNGLVVKKNN